MLGRGWRWASLFPLNSNEISASRILVLKRAPSRQTVNVVLVSALTYLDEIDQ